MSPRAAARLESLGFDSVYDYVAGKADWLANGMPVEGEEADIVRAGGLVREDVPTTRIDEPLPAVEARIQTSGWDVGVVIDDDNRVLGLLHVRQTAENNETAEGVMEEGPSTFRPDASPEQLLDYLQQNDGTTVLVTTNRGRLIGAVRKEDLERTIETA
ncbi:hypothetical protein BH23CHL1_BH23CHL1_11920 [soil metagenome]